MSDQKSKDTKKKPTSKGSRVNALVILICIDMIGFMASLYSLKAFSDANIFLIPAALTLVMSVITAMVYVQMRHQDEDNRQRIAGDVAEALSAIIDITKNNQKLMDDKIDELSEEYQVPAQEIINAVKALAKVSLGRSKENATALINSNEAVVTQVMDLQDKIDSLESTVNKASANDLSKVIEDNDHKVAVGLEDLSHDVQRLDQDMRRLEQVTKDLEIHPTVVQHVQSQNDQSDTDLSTDIEPSVEDEMEPVTDDELSAMLDASTSDTDDVDTGDDDIDLAIDDDSEDQEIGLDDLNIDEEPSEEPATEEDTSEEPVIEEDTSNEPEIDEITPEENQEEPVIDEEPVLEEDVPDSPAEDTTPVQEPESEPVPPVNTPAPDTSDPNKKLSPEDIAALFAQANSEATETLDTASEEAKQPTDNAETGNEGSSDTTPADQTPAKPAPEASGDPNRMMTPEEIEALFSNVS